NRRIRPDLRMTGHAGFSRRKTSEGRFLDARVAIATIDSEAGNVMLMAERDRLGEGRANARPEWRSIKHATANSESGDAQDDQQHGNFEPQVRASRKKLCH